MMMGFDDASEICYSCSRQVWVVALTVADIISDFLYFEELYSENKVPDGVAFAVLAFAIVGLVCFMTGPYATCGVAVAVLFEDIPVITTTILVQAYLAGADISQWHAVAIVSIVFSMFAMQQKLMELGLVRNVQDVLNPRPEADRIAEVGRCYWWVVFFRSLAMVAVTVMLAWLIAIFIIFFAPDPPER
ncbi:unnamed protein product [Scytosiphon promiscuus]